MDILDIDEVLKDDDSFIFLEEKDQDDVANILQQWKTNSPVCVSQEQAFKLNSRTFTRPKRKPAQNLEAQFNTQPMEGINLQIGGLVTSMQKSFLQDTSPPASICSSMDMSMDRMNNSLITSGDFSNISFLESNENDLDKDQDNMFAKPVDFDYSISDVIRDRKALENLTMSGESTIIKDSNIAQIDEMSLLSSSTMNNSTDSLSAGGVITSESSSPLNQTKVIEPLPLNSTFDAKGPPLRTDEEDLIANTTFNLVDSSNVANGTYVECRNDRVLNDTFKKYALNETMDLNLSVESPVTHGTPDNTSMKSGLHYIQSTPHHNTSNAARATLRYTPTIKGIIDEVNISPITSKGPLDELNKSPASVNLNSTFDKVQNSTFGKDDLRLDRTVDLRTENPIFEKIPDVDVGNIGADILEVSQQGEEDFYNLLDNIGKYTPTEEITKMKKSVDSIKKKYSCSVEAKTSGTPTSSHSPALITSTDRLLNRRSRLYDGIALSISSTLSTKESESPNEKDENTAEREETKTELPTTPRTPDELAPRTKNEKRDRDRDRFKTIRIIKRPDEPSLPNVPCIDDEIAPVIETAPQTHRFSRIDHNSAVFNNNTHEVDKYATYKKPKESKLQTQPAPSAIQPRSISRPRYISGLQKFGYNKDMSKAASVDDLEKSSITSDDSMDTPSQISVVTKPATSGVQSPMGTKAKSFHNLSNNFGYTMTKKPASFKASESSLSSASSKGSVVAEKPLKSDQNVFKIPTSTVSALRRPSAVPGAGGSLANAPRRGLVRPSSGYFGFNNSTKLDAGSETSHLTAPRTTPAPPAFHSKLNNTTVSSSSSNSSLNSTISVAANTSLPAKPSGIQRPSGLRPPSATGRRTLRPPSVVRR